MLVKCKTAPQYLPKPVITNRSNDCKIGVLHFGTSLAATHEALDELNTDGIAANDLRILAFPFSDEVLSFIEKHDQVFVVEQNRDAQMKTLLVNELEIAPRSLQSILQFNGDPISARKIRHDLEQSLNTDSAVKSA